MAAQSTLRIRIRHRAEGGNSQVIEEWGKCSGTGEYCAAFVHHGFIANFAAQLRRHIHKIECFADLREKCSDVQRYSAYARLRNVRFVCYILRV